MKSTVLFATLAVGSLVLAGCGGGGSSSLISEDQVVSVSPNTVSKTATTPVTINVTGLFYESGATWSWEFYLNGQPVGQGAVGDTTFTVVSSTQATLLINNPSALGLAANTYDLVVTWTSGSGAGTSSITTQTANEVTIN